MAEPAQKPHVLIIGAGIVGLLIAQGLKKNNIPFSIYEAESAQTYRPREWGCSIQWGLPMLESLLPESKYPLIYTASVDPSHEPEDPGRVAMLHGGTGELLKELPLNRMYRISRRRFRAFCAEGVEVRYGKRLVGVEYDDGGDEEGKGVTVRFEDGDEARGSMVVGADGANSRVREVVFGAEQGRAMRVPYAAVNLHVCYGDAEKARFVRQWHPIMVMGVHPEGYWLWVSIQEVPDPEDARTWVFQLQATWKAGDGEDGVQLEDVKRRAEGWGEPFRSAFEWIPEGTEVGVNKMAYWVPKRWDTKGGRVVLAGDAGHPMTFQRGQGLNHGIADAKNLVEGLAGLMNGRGEGMAGADGVAEKYMQELVDRAGDEVRTSKENTEMLHDWERMAKSPLMQRGGYARGKEPGAVEVKG